MVLSHPHRPRQGHPHEYRPKNHFQVDVVRNWCGNLQRQNPSVSMIYHINSKTSYMPTCCLRNTLNHRRGRYMARTAHRCPGYNRTEITLTANITCSTIVSHSSPIPHETCPVCKQVVKDTDVFNCICGSDGE